jgi:hypothetical protein
VIKITGIRFEFNKGPWDKIFCCPNRPDAKWLKASIDITNYGTLEEKFQLCVEFSAETEIKLWYAFEPGPWHKGFCTDVTLESGEKKTKTFHWSCIRTNKGYCDSYHDTLVPVDPSTHEFADYGFSPDFFINYNPLKQDELPAAAAEASSQLVICDTSTLACHKTSVSAVPSLAPGILRIESTEPNHSGLCGGTSYSSGGGWRVKSAGVIPILVDCDPYS